jgi:hypothetical protein
VTTFLDGPAAEKRLMLKRGPFLLRVTVAGSEVDALDQPNDEPCQDEQLFAYRMEGEPGRCHLNFGGGRGGWYVIATYRLITEQPSDAVMRSNSDWSNWCEQNAAALGWKGSSK